MTAIQLAPVEVMTFPSLREMGFEGGRYALRALCRRVFADNGPRFLRDDRGRLVVFRHADLRAFGAAPAIGNVPPAVLYPQHFGRSAGAEILPGRTVAEVVANQVFTANDPLHAPARRILTTWLAPRQVAAMEPVARDVAREVLTGLPHDRPVDFVAEVAEAFTVRFWSRLLGLGSSEAETILHSARTMTLLFRVGRTAEQTAALDAAFARYRDVLAAAAQRNLAAADPLANDLAAQVAALDVEDDAGGSGVAPKDLGGFLAGNLIDAFHTAALVAANTMAVLLRHPVELAAVAASPEKLPVAIAEALRLEPPVIMLGRWVLRDVEMAGVLLPKGAELVMLWAAGNLDPDAFPDPERFDLSRRLQGVTTFGGGAHICPGRHAAVMMTRVLLETITEEGLSFDRIENSERWLDRHLMCQLETLEVVPYRGN